MYFHYFKIRKAGKQVAGDGSTDGAILLCFRKNTGLALSQEDGYSAWGFSCSFSASLG
jgi:hypothetical protein